MGKLLIVVDMQKDFIDGSLGTDEALEIVDNVASYIEKCEKDGFDIVFTRDTHGEDYMDTQEGKKLPVIHCIKDTEGWQIDKKLRKYAEGKLIFDKPTFGSVKLMNYVTEKGYDEIHLLGLCTDICVISNAMLVKAALPEARICVVESCSAGVTPESHKISLEAMKSCQIEVV